MNLTSLWNDLGLSMNVLMGPAMIGAVALETWRSLGGRAARAPYLTLGAVVALLGATVWVSRIQLELGLPLVFQSGFDPARMLVTLGYALVPFVFGAMTVVLIGVIRVARNVLGAGRVGATAHPGTAVRVAVGVAATTLALAGVFWSMTLVRAGLTVGGGPIPSPVALADALRGGVTISGRLGTASVALGVAVAILSLHTARGGHEPDAARDPLSASSDAV